MINNLWQSLEDFLAPRGRRAATPLRILRVDARRARFFVYPATLIHRTGGIADACVQSGVEISGRYARGVFHVGVSRRTTTPFRAGDPTFLVGKRTELRPRQIEGRRRIAFVVDAFGDRSLGTPLLPPPITHQRCPRIEGVEWAAVPRQSG